MCGKRRTPLAIGPSPGELGPSGVACAEPSVDTLKNKRNSRRRECRLAPSLMPHRSMFWWAGAEWPTGTIADRIAGGDWPMQIPVLLDRSRATTLTNQLFEQIRDAIRQGRLAPGVKLPSSRLLADQLDIARNTAVR
eukprot:gene35343-41688_t